MLAPFYVNNEILTIFKRYIQYDLFDIFRNCQSFNISYHYVICYIADDITGKPYFIEMI